MRVLVCEGECLTNLNVCVKETFHVLTIMAGVCVFAFVLQHTSLASVQCVCVSYLEK